MTSRSTARSTVARTESARRAGLGAVMAASLAVTVLPALSTTATAASATSASATSPTANPLVPTALTLHGGQKNQQLGSRLAACSVDGDGLTDLTAVGGIALSNELFVDMPARRRTLGESSSFMGAPYWSHVTTDGTAGWTCAGDVNGDGFDDLLQVPPSGARVVSLSQSSGTRNASGLLVDNRVRNYTFPVGTTGLAATAAGSAGDVDGDGLGDVVVSQHGASTRGRTGNGRLWVLAGKQAATVPASVSTVAVGASGNTAADVALVIDGARTGDRLSVATDAGDLNGDGVDDLVVASSVAGKVWAVYGAERGATTREVDLAALDATEGRLLATQVGERTGGALGTSVAVGRVDADSSPDLLVGLGARQDDGTATDGALAVLRGGSTDVVDVDLVGGTVADASGSRGYLVTPERKGDALGHSVALGDLDGDGVDEIVAGAPGHDPAALDGAGAPASGTDTGAVYVLKARTGSAEQPLSGFTTSATGHRIDGTRGADQALGTASRFGTDVVVLGDVDGNGAADLAVSAPGRSESANETHGAVTVALHGELGSSLDLVLSRRVDDYGVHLKGTEHVVKASDLLDLRADLRLSTLQGLEGAVRFLVDGRTVRSCDGASTAASEPHRAFAFCEGLALDTPGEHTLTVEHAAVPGRHTAASDAARLLVTDGTRTTAEARTSSSGTEVVAGVVAVTSGVAVTEGTVDLVASDGTVLASRAPLAPDGTVTAPVPSGVRSTGVTATYSGTSTEVGGREVTVLGGSRAVVAAPRAPAASVVLSGAHIRFGGSASATLVLGHSVSGGAQLLVDGKVVRTLALTGTSTRFALPGNLGVGRHAIELRTTGTGEVPSVRALATLTVAKATSGKVTATAKRFRKGSRPRVTVKVGKASNGTRPNGKVTVKVGAAKTTVKLKASARGKVTVTLPRRSKRGTATVTFTPSARGTYTTPAKVRVALIPRT